MKHDDVFRYIVVATLTSELKDCPRQVIEAVESVTGRDVPRRIGPRRDGDPARLVADATLARQTLKWSPRYSDLHTIIEHAWRRESGRKSDDGSA